MMIVVAVFGLAGFNVAQANKESDIRDDIKDLQKKIDQETANLNSLNSHLASNQSQISAAKASIQKLTSEITRLEGELDNLNDQADSNRTMLAEYLRQIYYGDSEDELSGAFFSSSSLSDLSSDYDRMLDIKDKIADALQSIEDAKEEVAQTKEQISDKKDDSEEYLSDKQAETSDIVDDINESKLTIAQLDAKMSKLRSALSSFLGQSFSMDDVVDAVKFADKKTGVRKEFLFAVLDKETDLGRYTGGCTYDKSKMGSTNLSYFKDICDDLGYNYKKMKVSCALSYGIGGAMGVAQFMPSTWMGYKDAIADKTGNDPADPWNLKDGIMGMALYLKNKGGDSKSGEYQAAAMYYCGSNWKRTVCKNYANTVISWSKGYDDYF